MSPGHDDLSESVYRSRAAHRDIAGSHSSIGTTEARRRSVELLEAVGISSAARRLDQFLTSFRWYAQRVVIAIAMATGRT